MECFKNIKHLTAFVCRYALGEQNVSTKFNVNIDADSLVQVGSKKIAKKKIKKKFKKIKKKIAKKNKKKFRSHGKNKEG